MAPASDNKSSAKPDPLRALAIFLIAGGCGWFVMELEVLGARVLAPYFGSAVYVVMGSVIGVFLLSLAAGYVLGGWFSRKRGSQVVLGAVLLVAGAWLCCMPLFMVPLCEALANSDLDVTWGSLAAAFALFAVPTIALGTVSPTAVCWLTTHANRAGLMAGLVLCFSTVASFAGCLATAFYLVRLSARHTILTSGAIILVMGGAILLHGLLARKGLAPDRQ